MPPVQINYFLRPRRRSTQEEDKRCEVTLRPPILCVILHAHLSLRFPHAHGWFRKKAGLHPLQFVTGTTLMTARLEAPLLPPVSPPPPPPPQPPPSPRQHSLRWSRMKVSLTTAIVQCRDRVFTIFLALAWHDLFVDLLSAWSGESFRAYLNANGIYVSVLYCVTVALATCLRPADFYFEAAAEMNGWAWAALANVGLKGLLRKNDPYWKKARNTGIFLLLLTVVVAAYFTMGRVVRSWLEAPHILRRKAHDADLHAAAYLLGFMFNVSYHALGLNQGDNILWLLFEIAVLGSIIWKLEKLAEKLQIGRARRAMVLFVQVSSLSVAVALGFAWLDSFAWWYKAMVFQKPVSGTFWWDDSPFDGSEDQEDDYYWLDHFGHSGHASGGDDDHDHDDHRGGSAHHVTTGRELALCFAWYVCLVCLNIFVMAIAVDRDLRNTQQIGVLIESAAASSSSSSSSSSPLTSEGEQQQTPPALVEFGAAERIRQRKRAKRRRVRELFRTSM